MIEYLKIAWDNIRHRKLRSWLTMIGIFIGIAAVVALIAVGQGLEKSIEEQFQQLGTDKLFVSPKGGFGPPGTGTAVKLTNDDVETVRKTKGIDEASGNVMGFIKIEFDDEIIYQYLIGVDKEGEELYGEYASWEIETGKSVDENDKSKVTLGWGYGAKKVFAKEIKIREKILINDKEYKVVGIYKRIGSAQDDAQIYTNDQTAREILGLDDEVQFILARTSPGEDPREVAAAVKKSLRKARDLEKGKEDFVVQTFEELLESFQTIIGVVQVILIGIAAISLIVGSIGIMNTMYTSVLQRTQEIGIMKSIGARNSNIASLFLIESGLLGFFGGIIGVALGIGIAKAVEFAAAQAGYGILKMSFPWYLVLGALLFSFIIGMISGVLPAVRASKLNPVDALRYE
jgi:putative ABC transport system permease protein